MNIKELVKYIQSHPTALGLGAGLIARRTNSKRESVYKAKAIIKNKENIKDLDENKSLPRILIFDIETAPMKAYVWKRWKENISLDLTISEWFILCFSAKWLYSNEVIGEALTPEEIAKEDDYRICKTLWDLLNSADIVISHNGNKFDIPKVKSRFIINNLPPTKPFFSVDTCQIVKKQFGFSSNKLDALATYFGFEHKLETDFNLWKRCMEGDKEAMNYMLTYNKRDVTLLEEVYLKLLPYIKNHPNISNIVSSNEIICPNCGSSHLDLLPSQFYYTSVGKYALYRCECGALSRGRTKLNDKIKTTSVAY